MSGTAEKNEVLLVVSDYAVLKVAVICKLTYMYIVYVVMYFMITN